jgi:hypothetical protein
MYSIFNRVSYQSTISIKFQCRHQRNQCKQKNPSAHAACAAKISQKKEENALVARHVITKRAMSATRRSSQAKE